jgi:hypothetical protein
VTVGFHEKVSFVIVVAERVANKSDTLMEFLLGTSPLASDFKTREFLQQPKELSVT